MSDAEAVDDEYRARALQALQEGDGHGAHRWAKGWIGGGGAGLLDPGRPELWKVAHHHIDPAD